MKLLKILAAGALALVLAGCIVPPPDVPPAATGLGQACNVYDTALVDMTAMLRAGRLSLAQAERFNAIRSVVTPLCTQVQPDIPAALRGVEAELLKMETLKREVR